MAQWQNDRMLNMRVSYWEQSSMLSADFVVIGAGIIGLSTAIELASQHPSARIIVLERGVIPAGASSRNAGFACFGSLTELIDDMALMGLERTLQLVHDRWHGLALLRKRVGDAHVGYDAAGNFEVIPQALLAALDRLPEINTHLRQLGVAGIACLSGASGDVFVRADDRIADFGFCPTTVRALVHNRGEGLLDPGRLLARLGHLAQSLGVDIRYGARVVALHDEGDAMAIAVHDAATDCDILLRAHAVGVCTNGFTRDLLPDADIVPARGQVLVTEPISDLRFRGAFHMDRGFVYFRHTADDRILLGGARNLDTVGETTTDLTTTQPIMQHLEHILYNVILHADVDTDAVRPRPAIAMRWAGIMGFSSDKTPRVQASSISRRCIIGFGCNGMGVAMGSAVAQRTAVLMRNV